MTTIAWDGRTLAVDRGGWSGYTAYSVTKLFDVRSGDRLKGQRAVALSGDSHVALSMLEWLRGGELPRFPESAWNKNCGVIVTVDRRLFRLATGMAVFEPIESPLFADGGGMDYAMGAMLAGASAKRAIELAAKRTSLSWGGVDYIRIPRPRK